MRSIVFEGRTWNVYEDIRKKDKNLHRNLCKIITELQRSDPTTGTGKPEPLKHNLSGYWSRRISQKDRIIYKFDNDHIYICNWRSLRIEIEIKPVNIIGLKPIYIIKLSYDEQDLQRN